MALRFVHPKFEGSPWGVAFFRMLLISSLRISSNIILTYCAHLRPEPFAKSPSLFVLFTFYETQLAAVTAVLEPGRYEHAGVGFSEI